jgi:hypothetical protein
LALFFLILVIITAQLFIVNYLSLDMNTEFQK